MRQFEEPGITILLTRNRCDSNSEQSKFNLKWFSIQKFSFQAKKPFESMFGLFKLCHSERVT